MNKTSQIKLILVKQVEKSDRRALIRLISID